MYVEASEKLKLRLLISSGAPLTWTLLKRLSATLRRCRILNLYGCTEAAADSACWDAGVGFGLGTEVRSVMSVLSGRILFLRPLPVSRSSEKTALNKSFTDVKAVCVLDDQCQCK